MGWSPSEARIGPKAYLGPGAAFARRLARDAWIIDDDVEHAGQRPPEVLPVEQPLDLALGTFVDVGALLVEEREDEALGILDPGRFAEGRLVPEPQVV